MFSGMCPCNQSARKGNSGHSRSFVVAKRGFGWVEVPSPPLFHHHHYPCISSHQCRADNSPRFSSRTARSNRLEYKLLWLVCSLTSISPSWCSTITITITTTPRSRNPEPITANSTVPQARRQVSGPLPQRAPREEGRARDAANSTEGFLPQAPLCSDRPTADTVVGAEPHCQLPAPASLVNDGVRGLGLGLGPDWWPCLLSRGGRGWRDGRVESRLGAAGGGRGKGKSMDGFGGGGRLLCHPAALANFMT